MGCLNNEMLISVGKFGIFLILNESLMCVVYMDIVYLFIKITEDFPIVIFFLVENTENWIELKKYIKN